MANTPGIDQDDPGEYDEIEQLIDQFFTSTLAGRLDALSSALDRSDKDTLISIGHELKGSIGVYRIPQLGEIGGAIEKAAKGSIKHQEIADLIDQARAFVVPSDSP